MSIENSTLHQGGIQRQALFLNYENSLTTITDFIYDQYPAVDNFSGWGDYPLWLVILYDIVYTSGDPHRVDFDLKQMCYQCSRIIPSTTDRQNDFRAEV
jgi:hypothetical protein